MQNYRNITESEISKLQAKKCKCTNWGNIMVKEGFTPDFIEDTTFSGKVKLGVFKKNIQYPGGIKKHSGISNAYIHNCTIGDNCLISHVKNYIANYEVEDNVVIENCELISVEEETSFGNGTPVNVMDETGGRQLLIYDQMSAHSAYFQAFYKHRPRLIQTMEKMILDYSKNKSCNTGRIGSHTRISNCKQITNVNFGSYSSIMGVSRLKNGSVNSNQAAPVTIGPGVIADDFIISSGSEIIDGTILNNCFIGQGCILGKHYSAAHSLFFSNCQGFHGEACSIFAGPYTVTHHKSTLLIAGMFSFLNAGSGSNQSNHMYKLGPIHHGIIERGTKTTSDSYILWPAKIGPFTLVMGRHYKNPDTTDMPFSYLIENKDESWLVPAVNLRSVGTIRDAMKWPKRDNRKDPEKHDFINHNLLSPYTIARMVNGKNILEELQKTPPDSSGKYSWGTTSISKKSLERGIFLYKIAIVKFLGNSLISKLLSCNHFSSVEDIRNYLKPGTNKGEGDWVDLSGLITPKSEVEELISKIENGVIHSLKEIEGYFRYLHESYYTFEWTWAAMLLEKHLKKSIGEITVEDLSSLIRDWVKSVVQLDELLYVDAKKEFTLSAMTGFGIDGDYEVKKQDFEKVRGSFEKNILVTEILNHIQRKTKLGNRTIEMLEKTGTA